ncbi:MAG: phosphate ABC transporter permease, partial [Desulfococcus multivorans]|nr:phosphate ABC transporter permease [Desulfococcus multivorans]
MERLFLAAAVLSASLAALILGFMVLLGLPILGGGGFWTSLSQPWMPHKGIYGILPMIVGTLSISMLALCISFPVSLGCALATRLIKNGPVVWVLSRTVQLMTAMPTVVYGFVGIFLLVPLVRSFFQTGSGMCILSASLLLSVLISP